MRQEADMKNQLLSDAQIATIRHKLSEGDSLVAALELSIAENRKVLMNNVASADGLQHTGSKLATVHHFANVLFNNMRGGVFASNYTVETRDFLDFVAARNSAVNVSCQAFLRELPERVDYPELLERVGEQRSTDLLRLTLEYLPLTFSRRHGDPSRPWNTFAIHVENPDGSRVYNFQGNWRDIFQNWEALCYSFPSFLTSVVAKFVNASTIDGFNPYRITRSGVDWEVPDPEDPWSNIGYWGDHQIIYLTKLLEALQKFAPAELAELFESQIFCYANVPYRIRPYEKILADSCQTIDFDKFTAQQIDRRVETLGADGKLLLDARGNVYYANLTEKVLVSILAKLSNFVVDGGIWLNTQRPEWNDANNALVGSGLSMVTVCHLRRHLDLLARLLREIDDRRIAISVEVEQWFRNVRSALQDSRSLLHHAEISDEDRGHILNAVGRAFSDYRLKVYEDGFSGKHTISATELVEFFRLVTEYLDHSIRASRREDCLYHSYNLLDVAGDEHVAGVSHLYEMLEGQVAALSSGILDSAQAVELIDAMFHSKIYRPDQRTFMLYPDRSLPGFLHRNQIPADQVREIDLLQHLLESDDDSLVTVDIDGEFHFSHAVQKRADLENRLDELSLVDRWSEEVARDRAKVLELFEDVFQHKTYTGRSGTMYGYEGLGCVYWHMVSKLLLAVQENVFRAVDRQASKAVIEALADAYYLIRGGLSSDKTPSEYGAFPADPYSHTPMHVGAQQPGMTGQVKEEVLTRQGELGVRVADGQLRFQPTLLRRREFLQEGADFIYYDLQGSERQIALHPGSLAFTVCQTPVVYQLTDGPLSVDVRFASGDSVTRVSDRLDAEQSRQLFHRSGDIDLIQVNIPEESIVRA